MDKTNLSDVEATKLRTLQSLTQIRGLQSKGKIPASLRPKALYELEYGSLSESEAFRFDNVINLRLADSKIADRLEALIDGYKNR